MNAIVIYFDEQKHNKQVIKPTKQFNGDVRGLLEKYTKFLQENGYIDTDATCEEPFAIDEFLKINK